MSTLLIARRRSIALGVLAFGLLLYGIDPDAAGAPVQATRTGPTTHTITIDATAFSPAELTLKPGDSIEWVNKDLIPHTATSVAAKDKGGFDSGVIAPGKSWKFTPKATATLAYVCTFHPTMKGTLRVKK